MLLDALFARIPSVRARLTLLTAVLCLLMSGLALAGMTMLARSNESLRTVYDDRVVPLQQIKAVADAYAVTVVDSTHKVRLGQLDAAAAARQIEAAGELIRRQWSAYSQTYLVPEEKALVARITPLLAEAERLRSALLAALAAGDDSALARLAGQQLYQLIDPLSDQLNALVAVQLDVARREYEQGRERYAQARWAAWLGLGLACLMGAVIAGLISGRIMRSLGGEPSDVRQVAQGIAHGTLNQRLRVAQDDRSSVMAHMLAMQRGLAGMVREVRANVDELHAASGQIAQGNFDLSSRTEETAATTQRASARLDEVMQRLRLRIASAGEARALADGTRAVAQRAGSQMGEAIASMQGIDAAAQRIGDITGVIDGIAFQTNILALNAAVEAARAGESGRGFAVVASEVRALAQRAGEAAREIKTLISDTTERTEAGSRQVRETGQTLQQMVAEIQQLSGLMLRLDQSSGQDGQDISELQLQVQELDRVAQQNAALVEEMAASSEQLKDQAGRLAQAVQVFSV
ncbi:methyl-accepting chemotaxis protein [Paucibacter sp. XJ19-41]|uniref:methyl-accepting chemotaxis protein n=1 Tax=Paucibacter sp. XJ19-41 TaxID=2927824 RepID=UPI00234B7943|nr:methyl-accepting chemotaxis protein [Paucibacter sp. XJ19-41]MDC6165839.1 methyl-accepting chemotaxis protein [Paucibacter sp. XJ19-41]